MSGPFCAVYIKRKRRKIMYTIKTLNNIAATGLAKLPAENFIVDNNAEDPHGIILRSFDMHKIELNKGLLAVARAGAGTNNIPIRIHPCI